MSLYLCLTFDLNFKFFFCRISYGVYYFFFPPKHKFLSLEEYALEGAEETSRALEDLREYCKSPECDTWRVVSRLKHPARYDVYSYLLSVLRTTRG